MIDPKLIERIMLLIAVAGPLGGLIIGIVLSAHEKCALPRVISGFLIGLLGTCAYGLWRIYGIITNRLGLDSVANLIVEIVMFAVAGMIIGFVAYKISKVIKRVWAVHPLE